MNHSRRDRVFNFCSGPAMLPDEVMEQAREEFLNWKGTGMSVMELSHRSDLFVRVVDDAEAALRRVLGLDADWRVLFLQGGASLQFSAIPLNLAGLGGVADFVDTGIWSRKAHAEAARYMDPRIIASAADNGYTAVPAEADWSMSPDAAWLHLTPNETIGGVEYDWLPENTAVPIVADLSSTILSRPLAVDRYRLIYAGAQKNVGPAGLTLVLVHSSLLGHAAPETPAVMNYQTQSENGSMYNTPPTWAIYLANLVFAWIERQGGLAEMDRRSARRAETLYAYIDRSDFYTNPIAPDSRSRMNIPFRLRESAHEQRFLLEAERAGLTNLQGHRSVGGLRASLYNAMPQAGVDALVEFMDAFARKVA